MKAHDTSQPEMELINSKNSSLLNGSSPLP
jgi:hypothetical protein